MNELSNKTSQVKLPSRRQGGMTLSYSGGDLFVTFFGYSASLSCASNEGLLMPTKYNRYDEYELKPNQQKIVDEWMARFDDYFEVNGWPTWADVNE